MAMECAAEAPPSRRERARQAWTEFWREPGQTRCASGAPAVWHVLQAHWQAFATGLSPGARVLDLCCGAGAAAQVIAAARDDVRIVGVDHADIPLLTHQRIDLLPNTAAEALPFDDGSFDAVVSQFGYEYCHLENAATETRRVLAAQGKVWLLVHHAGSSIVATNRMRLDAIAMMLREGVGSAFCTGDADALEAELASLSGKFPDDPLVVQFARSLASRLGREQPHRVAIWGRIKEALAPERDVLLDLLECCVAPEEMGDWLAPLSRSCTVHSATALYDRNCDPIAWAIVGAPKPAR